MNTRIILLHADAPPKPAPGQPCNGCGVCCVAQTCPIGMVASRRLAGPCTLLRWNPQARQYRCGALPSTAASTQQARTWWARHRRACRRWLQSWQTRLALRWIAAGRGCDCSLQATRPPAG